MLLRLPRLEEFPIARIPLDHARWIGQEEVAQHGALVVDRQLFGGLQGQIEQRVARRIAGVLFYLHHHRRHQVEGLVDFWEFFQNPHHAVVVL